MVLPLIAAGLAALAPTAIEWIENAFGSDDEEDYDDYEYTDEDEQEGNWWFW